MKLTDKQLADGANVAFACGLDGVDGIDPSDIQAICDAVFDADLAHLRGLLWYAWYEMNAIRARSGVPLDFDGRPQSIVESYWSDVVDAMAAVLGDDAKPWASDDAKNALAAPRGKEMA